MKPLTSTLTRDLVLSILVLLTLDSTVIRAADDKKQDPDLCPVEEEKLCKANSDKGLTFCCNLISKVHENFDEYSETFSLAKCCSEDEFYAQFPVLNVDVKAEPR